MKTIESQNWSEIIREAAISDARTQAELAAVAGMTQPQLSRFLTGKRALMGDALGKLAEAVGLMIVRRP